ncbi:ABC transporter ATP-binding protein [Corynebacterium sp. 335C]
MSAAGADAPGAEGTADAAVDVRDVRLRYLSGPEGEPTEHGLDDVTFDAAPGTLTLLCGPSGSGKSTVLKLLNGLVPGFHSGELSGSVHVAGVDVPNTPLHDAGRTTATVFQNPRTGFFNARVVDELAFGLENLGLPREEILARVDEAAAVADVVRLLGRDIMELSGGEVQRVAAAAAIAAEPRVLLLDEPSSNLSPAAVGDLRALIADLRSRGVTMVVAEHRLHYLRGLVDRVLYLRDGRVAERFTGDAFFALDDGTRRRLGLRRLAPTPAREPDPWADDAPGLRVEGLRFGYRRGQTVLDVDRMDFPASRITALTGPNGAGKTTLARIVCGLEKENRGAAVSLDGVRLTADKRRGRAYIVMQDVARQLFTESVEHEVELGLDGVDARALLAEVDLAGLEDRHPQSLSGGQRQRLVIASAMARRPRICIFDEPTSGVGREHLLAIGTLMRRLADDGVVVIVITHDEELVEACADRVIALPGREEP